MRPDSPRGDTRVHGTIGHFEGIRLQAQECFVARRRFVVRESETGRQNARATSPTARAARAIQTTTTTTAATLFTGLSFASRASSAALGQYVGWDHLYRQRDPERDEDQVVQVSEDRDYVGYEIYGAEGVPDHDGGEDARVPGHPLVLVGEIQRVHLDLEPVRPRLEPPDRAHRLLFECHRRHTAVVFAPRRRRTELLAYAGLGNVRGIVDMLVRVIPNFSRRGRGEAEGLEGGVMVTDVVHLEGGMGDTVFAGEEVFEFAPAGVAVFLASDEDVGGEGGEARRYGPDVEVVDLDDALGRGHLPAHFGWRPGLRGVASRRMLVESLRSFQELPRIRSPMATLIRGSA